MTVFRAQTSAKASIAESDPGLNADFRINPYSDLDVGQITLKILWIHYLVSVSHFAECRKRRPANYEKR